MRDDIPGNPSILSAYRRLAAAAAKQAYVPYSGQHEAVLLVLHDGTWIPGVRVESAAFSLTIPPLQNAATTAVALNAGPIRAVVASRALRPADLAYARGMHLIARLPSTAPDVLGEVPDVAAPGDRLLPFVARGAAAEVPAEVPAADSDDTPSRAIVPTGSAGSALVLVRRIARRAHVPASGFPVGCLVEVEGRGYIPGVNVEHEDWTSILCAERNALGTAVSYGRGHLPRIFLSCARDRECTPCGACRQLLAELAPASTLWMDRGDGSPSTSDPITLLPDFFSGKRLSGDA